MDRQMDHAVYLKTFFGFLAHSLFFLIREMLLSLFSEWTFFSSKTVLKTQIKIKENNNATETNKKPLISQTFKNFILVFCFSK